MNSVATCSKECSDLQLLEAHSEIDELRKANEALRGQVAERDVLLQELVSHAESHDCSCAIIEAYVDGIRERPSCTCRLAPWTVTP